MSCEGGGEARENAEWGSDALLLIDGCGLQDRLEAEEDDVHLEPKWLRM